MKKYFITLLSGVFISIAFLATFNWFVNPYNVFSSPAIKGFNALKVAAGRRGRLSKVYEVNRLQPDIIILGSSRELSIPVEPLQTDSESAYNLALANGSGYEMYRMFQHANAIHPLKTVIIGIDEGFGGGIYENFVEERLKVDSKNQPTDSWRPQPVSFYRALCKPRPCCRRRFARGACSDCQVACHCPWRMGR